MKKITVSGMSEQELADTKKEILILSVMKHPNIVRYKRSFVRRGALCIVMEYADGGDLHHMIKQQRHLGKHFDEGQILDWFTQACLGLKHVHDHKILHRDLKTQNIFLTSKGEVRLGDFGISRVLKNTLDQAHTLVGTPYYLSPEMVNGLPYDHRSDIWSMGVVLYELLTLQHPFNADSLQMLALKIIQGNYPPIPKEYSKAIDDLLSRMLEQDVKKRLDIEAVLRTPIIMERVKKFYPDHEIFGGPSTLLLEESKFEDAADDDDEDDEKDKPATKALVTPTATCVKKPSPEVDPPKIHKAKLPPLPVAEPDKPKIPTPVCAEAPAPMISSVPKKPIVPAPRLDPGKSAAVSKAGTPLPTKKAAPAIEKVGGKPGAPKSMITSFLVKDVEDEEPDWDVGDHLSVASDAASPARPASSKPFQEPSVARGTQVDILRSYLEERLGPVKLRKIIEYLQSKEDDAKKQKNVEKLIEGHNALLPIIHTLMYLSSVAK